MRVVNLSIQLLRTVLISLVLAFGASMVFFLLNFLSLSMTDPENIRYHLKLSFENKTHPMARGSYNDFNDCLITAMTLSRNARVDELTVSPMRIYGLQRPQDICRGLKQLAYDGSLNKDQYITVFYHQYLHGSRTVLSFLLDSMRVKDIRTTLFAICYLILLLNLFFLFIQIGQELFNPQDDLKNHAGTDLRKEFFREKLSLVIFSLCFLFFYDLSGKADSFTFSFTDILIFSILSMATFFNSIHMRFLVRVIFFAGFGALLAYFELLHGAVPLAMAGIIGIFFVQRVGDQSEMVRYLVCIESFFAFLAGFLGCFVFKIIAVSIYFDVNMLTNFLDLLMFRMTGVARTTSVPEEIRSYFVGYEASFLDMLISLKGQIPKLAFGSRKLGYMVVGSSGIILAFFTILLMIKPSMFRNPHQTLGLLFSNCFIVLWYVAFLQHTQEHPYFMTRLLVWPIASSCVLLMNGTECLLSYSKGWNSSFRRNN